MATILVQDSTKPDCDVQLRIIQNNGEDEFVYYHGNWNVAEVAHSLRTQMKSLRHKEGVPAEIHFETDTEFGQLLRGSVAASND